MSKKIFNRFIKIKKKKKGSSQGEYGHWKGDSDGKLPSCSD
jgi:hypothetical protein